jgi:hypothetical protein
MRAAEGALDGAPKHEKHQGVKEKMEEPSVQELIRDKLPGEAMLEIIQVQGEIADRVGKAGQMVGPANALGGKNQGGDDQKQEGHCESGPCSELRTTHVRTIFQHLVAS